MNRTALCLTLCTLIGVAGCSSPKEELVDREFNPKRELWHSVALQTDYFQESGATRAEWAAKGDQVQDVTNLAQLQNILDGASLQYSQKCTAVMLFKRGYDTLHVGFWDRFQALVFFEKDHPKVIMKW